MSTAYVAVMCLLAERGCHEKDFGRGQPWAFRVTRLEDLRKQASQAALLGGPQYRTLKGLSKLSWNIYIYIYKYIIICIHIYIIHIVEGGATRGTTVLVYSRTQTRLYWEYVQVYWLGVQEGVETGTAAKSAQKRQRKQYTNYKVGATKMNVSKIESCGSYITGNFQQKKTKTIL
jgi:hypothetical protein